MIYADFDEDDRSPKQNNNNNNNGPVEAEVEALLHNINQPSSRDNTHHISINHNSNRSNNFDHSGNAQAHFVNSNNNHNSNFKNNKPQFNPNAEIIVVPIHKATAASSNNNARSKPTNGQLNAQPNASPPQSTRTNRNHQSSNRNSQAIRHPRLEPGVLPPNSNGFIGVIFDDEDPSYSEQPPELPSPPPIPSLEQPNERNGRSRNKPSQPDRPVSNNSPTHHHHHNPQSTPIQSTTPLTTAIVVAHNHESLRTKPNAKPDWQPSVDSNNNNNFGNREKDYTDNYNLPIFEHERNTLPPTVKPSRQSNTNRQRPNANRDRSSSRNSYPTTTTTTTTTTEPSTTRWQPTSTSRPNTNSNGRMSGASAIAANSQNGPGGRRKSNKRLQIAKAKSILDNPPALASRPAPIYETPIVGSQAKKCDRNICRLPDCNCGGSQIPAGLKEKEIPQLVSNTNSPLLFYLKSELNFILFF